MAQLAAVVLGIHRTGIEAILAAVLAGLAAVDVLAAVELGIHRTGSACIEVMLAAMVLAGLAAVDELAAVLEPRGRGAAR